MMGICACRAMKHQDYKARLSVTPRERIRGFKGPRYVRRLDAFDGLEPVQRQQGEDAGAQQAGRRAKKPTRDTNDDVQDVTDLPRQSPKRATRAATRGPRFGFLRRDVGSNHAVTSERRELHSVSSVFPRLVNHC